MRAAAAAADVSAAAALLSGSPRVAILCARTGVGLVALLLAGCVQTGDFGRPRAGVAADGLAVTGSVSASLRGELVSPFPFTDDEQEMRDRAWRFLMPAQERSWFERALAELTRTRILPAVAHPADPAAYGHALAGEPARSPASRYRRLSEDIQADHALVAPFIRTATRVAAADQVRLRSFPYVRGPDDWDLAGAAARVAENRCLAAWVAAEWHRRAASYRFALERLLIETPQAQAVPTERAIARFDADLAAIRGAPPIESCAGDVAAPSPAVLPGGGALVSK